MSDNTTTQSGEKPGFMKRIFNKIDTVMKEKADQQEGCCCCESGEEKGSPDSCCHSDETRKTDGKCC